ncbi:ABC transporter permease [Actinophytocola algeriensis]|uniref:Peptide/nickel transport system permease protein n=1 Tax=Actinophytocola algeriensis TaxID=1768010 RepID=A0A7W7Q7V4_9PSEU|nr:ABC transporter permease [Actinophytocola algeriensis]MBB4908557.1 peptide/nickel transport system permease protein [Actinophytocola algeriensis]MBE1475056.1 peptide/nickel transport system permease protein [Actinophytocola algeriensis]
MTDTTELTPPRPRRVRAGSSWTGFALRRLGGLAGTVVIAVVVTFVIVPLIPGDPAVSAAGPDATIDQINRVRAELGLDRPLYERFFDYVGGLLQGDLGHSFSLNAPVSEVVFRRLPFTAGLSFLALLVVLVLAVPLGMAIGALTRGGKRRRLDSTFNYVTAVVAAIPPYVMATLLVLLFAVTLEVLPPAYTRSQPGLSLLLPAFALSLPSICLIARVVRRETAVVLEQDFLRTARGWRLSGLRMALRYVLPNVLTSTLTLSGIVLVAMLGGAISVETVFGWPGLGLGVVNAVATKDYPLVQGIVLILAVLSALMTMAVDVLLGIVDPRVRGGQHV